MIRGKNFKKSQKYSIYLQQDLKQNLVHMIENNNK